MPQVQKAGDGEALETHLRFYNEETCPVENDVEVPKVLGDVLESVLGAVFIDGGMRLDACWRVLRNIFPQMDEYIRTGAKNPVADLYERPASARPTSPSA